MLTAPNSIVLRRHRPGDIGHVIHRHGVVYFKDYGWGEKFEAMVAQILAEFINSYDPNVEHSWIAEQDGVFAGSIFLVKDKELENTARIRGLLVEHVARGMGLGGQLVQNCVDFAREAGYQSIILSTQSILTGARKLYKAAGFRRVSEDSSDDFMPNSRGETWQLTL
ncbi:hypothetical protein TrVFT333_002467 [Trichoderma virens FT-333]|nr:hypothetical protein TrVFT333_002467 [Trichoderma virens FT-333]